MKTLQLKKVTNWAVLIILLGFVLSCKKDKKESIKEDEAAGVKIALKFDKTSFKQAEMGTITFEGFYTPEKLNVKVGTADMMMIKNTLNQFTFIIPSTVKGDIQISAPQLDKSYAITVTETKVTAPDVYMKTYMANRENIFEGMQAGLDSLVKAKIINQKAADVQVQNITDSLDNALKKFDQLPEDQKLLAVKYLESNSVQLKEIEQAIKTKLRPKLEKFSQLSLLNEKHPSFMTKCAADEVLAQAVCVIFNDIIPLGYEVAKYTVLTYAVITLSAGTGWGVPIGIGIAGTIVALKLAPAVVEFGEALWEISKSCLKYLGDVSKQLTSNSYKTLSTDTYVMAATAVVATPEYRNNIANQLSYRLKARNLQPTKDVDDFGELFKMFNEFKKIFDLPLATKFFGKAPVWAAEVSRYIAPAKLSYITVQTDNANVTGAVSGALNDIKLTFKTTQTTDQPFNYTLVYNDGSFGEIKSLPSKALLAIQSPYNMVLVSGNNQTGQGNDAFARPAVVKVTDKEGKIVQNVEVNWVVTLGGGKVSAAKTVTDAQGLAQVIWTAGREEKQELSASAKKRDGTLLNGAPIKFSAVATVPAAIQLVSGNNQTAEVGKAVANPLVVKVTDKDGKVLKNIDVNWTVTAGDGKLSDMLTATNAQGLAQVNITAGTAEKVEISASAKKVDGTLLSGAPVKFSVTVSSPSAIQYVSGNNQTTEVNKALASPLVVKITDKAGKAMPNVEVSWAVTAGDGKLSVSKSITSAQGLAQVILIAGSADKIEVSASAKKADGTLLSGAPVKFAATVSSPYSIQLVSGNGQRGEANQGLAKPFVVKVADRAGKAMPNINVNWVVTLGNGRVSAAQTATNSSGLAQVNFTPGNASKHEITASGKKADGTLLSGAPVTFTALPEIDSTEIYKALAMGNWSVVLYDNGKVTSNYRFQLNSNGTGKYPKAENNFTQDYAITWTVRKNEKGYFIYMKGFWHYAFDELDRDRLNKAMTGFKTYAYGTTDKKTVTQVFTKQ